MMIQFSWVLPPRARKAQTELPAWPNDLLQHPELALMDQRQLADLPMPRLAAPMSDRKASPQAKGAARSDKASTLM